MNERILELADKAVEDMPSGPWNIPDEFCEKFGALIVRECVQLALDEKQRYRNISHRDMSECAVAMDNYQLLLKEHFGVEL